MTTAWITKYALTNGIFKVEAELSSLTVTMCVYTRPGCYQETAHGNDWHLTEAEAIVRAEQMRIKKIESLRKSIAKLEKLRFAP